MRGSYPIAEPRKLTVRSRPNSGLPDDGAQNDQRADSGPDERHGPWLLRLFMTVPGRIRPCQLSGAGATATVHPSLALQAWQSGPTGLSVGSLAGSTSWIALLYGVTSPPQDGDSRVRPSKLSAREYPGGMLAGIVADWPLPSSRMRWAVRRRGLGPSYALAGTLLPPPARTAPRRPRCGA